MSSAKSRSSKKREEKLKALRNGSLQDKLGIQFPLATVLAFLKEGKYAERVYVASSVYLTVVLESLTREILEVAGNKAKDKNKSRISPSHIVEAVRNNEELKQMVTNVTIPSGGVIPRIRRKPLRTRGEEREKEATATT